MIYVNGQATAEFVPEIADNLTTDDSTKALSAKQGKVLNEKIDDIGNIDTIIAPTNSATSSSYTLENYKAILFVLCNSTGKQVYATTIIPKGLISNSIVTSTNVYATTSEADFTFTNSQINLTALSNTYSAVYGVK